MKLCKIISLFIACIMLISLVACAGNDDELCFDIKAHVKLTVNIPVRAETVEITDTDVINQITQNINGLTFAKDKENNGYEQIAYILAWYDESGKKLEEVKIRNDKRIKYGDYFYDVTNDKKIDIDCLESYLYPFYDKPENTQLEFWITEDVASRDFSEYSINPGWMGAVEYYGRGYSDGDTECVSYLVTAYPDYADGGSFVTKIAVTDPEVKILDGLTASSSVEEWDAALQKLNFTREECNETLDEEAEYKEIWHSNDNKVSVTLSKREEGYLWNIYVPVSDRENIMH